MQKGLRLQNLKYWLGTENYSENNAIPDEKVYYSNNARFANKILSSKKGWTKLGNALNGGTKFQCLESYPFFTGNSTDERLIGVYNKQFNKFDNATQLWTSIAGVWPNMEDVFTDSVVYANNIYFVNPCGGAGNGVAKLSDSTFSVISAGVGSPRGTAIEAWLERLWIVGDPTSPDFAYASKPASASGFSTVEDFDTTNGATIVPVGKGGRLRAMRVINNEMYFFKSNGIYQLTADRFVANLNPVELSRTSGAINQQSVIVVENDIWFLTPELEVRSLGSERNMGDNPRTKNISEVIKKTMAILDPDQVAPVMTYNDRLVKIHLRTKDSPTNNITLIFDYNTGGWSVDRGQAVAVATIYGSEVVYGEDATGQCFVDEMGYSFNGTDFNFEVNTGFQDNSRPDTFKRARYIYVRGKQSYYQDLTIRLFRDGDYTKYSDYYIPSPYARGVTQAAISNDGQYGSSQSGNAIWGGAKTDTADNIQTYIFTELIGVQQKSNMFALGFNATINDGNISIDQAEVKIIDETENYKRTDI